MEPYYIIKINRRPWWAFWRSSRKLNLKVWEGGERLKGLLDVQWFRSIEDAGSVQFNGRQIFDGELWYQNNLVASIDDFMAGAKVMQRVCFDNFDGKLGYITEPPSDGELVYGHIWQSR